MLLDSNKIRTLYEEKDCRVISFKIEKPNDTESTRIFVMKTIFWLRLCRVGTL